MMEELKITRERAIKRMEWILKHEIYCSDKLSHAAINMAITALRSAEPENKALTAENEELKGRFAGSGEKSEYIKVPNNLSRELLIREFGTRAVEWYESYLADRIREGKIYLNPQKTIYLWATRDRKTGGGWFSRLPRQYDGHKSKGHGGS